MKHHNIAVIVRATWAPTIALIAMSFFQAILFDQRGMPWRGEYFWTAQWIESNSFPALIATSVAVALDAVRVFATNRYSIIATDDLRRPTLVTYLGLVTLGLAIPYLIAFATGAMMWPELFSLAGLWALAHAVVAFTSIMAILVIVLAIGVAIGIPGLAVGPIVAVALGYVAMEQEGLVLLGASTGSMLGFEPAALTLALQLVTAIVIICTLGSLILRWPTPREKTSRGHRSALVFSLVAVLGVSGGLRLVPYTPTLRGEIECLGSIGGPGVSTCVSYEHSRLGQALHERLKEVEAAGERFGVADTLPNTVLEDFTLTRAGLDTLHGFPDDLGHVAYWRPSVEELADPRAQISRESFAESLATPILCPQLRAEEPPSLEFWEEVAARTDALQTMVNENVSDEAREAAARMWSRSAAAFNSCDFQ